MKISIDDLISKNACKSYIEWYEKNKLYEIDWIDIDEYVCKTPTEEVFVIWIIIMFQISGLKLVDVEGGWEKRWFGDNGKYFEYEHSSGYGWKKENFKTIRKKLIDGVWEYEKDF